MLYTDIIAQVSSELNMSKTLVDRIYRAYWRSIREHISSLPLKEDLSDDEFLSLRPNINIPSIGKLYVNLDRYHRVKYQHLRSEEKINKNKDKDDTH